MRRVAKYFLIWMVICSISAFPSLHFALMGKYDLSAMLLGILIFAIGYTYISLTPWFQKMKRNLIWKRAFLFGAGLRLFLSLAAPIVILIATLGAYLRIPTEGMAKIGVINGLDFALGMGATLISAQIFGPGPPSTAERDVAISNTEFFPTLFTTILQGIFLNIVLLITILLAVLVQKLYAMKKGQN